MAQQLGLWQQRLADDFYDGSPEEIAQRLLGTLLVRQWSDGTLASGIIVEVEAYLAQNDPASHSYRGMRKRNASMFKSAGTLYVYTIHTRCCLNIVTEAEGVGSAVLIRAVEPYTGIARMRECTQADRYRRQSSSGLDSTPAASIRPRTTTAAAGPELTAGPGRLCRALDIDLQLDGLNLRGPQDDPPALWIARPPEEVSGTAWNAVVTRRIGISQAQERPLRWFMDGNEFVSGFAREHSRGRNWRFMKVDS